MHFCSLDGDVKNVVKSILTEGFRKFEKIKKALAQGVGEINFGSFELLLIKYGFVVEMGSQK